MMRKKGEKKVADVWGCFEKEREVRALFEEASSTSAFLTDRSVSE